MTPDPGAGAGAGAMKGEEGEGAVWAGSRCRVEVQLSADTLVSPIHWVGGAGVTLQDRSISPPPSLQL